MIMKKGIHPTTNPVIFVDSASGAEFVTASTLSSEETRDINGVAHFVIRVEISSASHPFFTGEERFVDTAGRVDKFKAKLERVGAAAEARKGKKAKQAARAAAKTQDETPAPKAKKKEEKIEETPVVEETATEPAVEATSESTPDAVETPTETKEDAK
jgi:large subunit ribosomal protein L31